MASLHELIEMLEDLAPPRLAEPWDNVGLLVGDRRRSVSRVMTCLTITRSTADEALAERADLIVTHHPLPFRPLQRVTSDTPEGRLLLDLIAGGVAIYSAHTAFDSARLGINQRLAGGLGLDDITPLVPPANLEAPAIDGGGRFGSLPKSMALDELAVLVRQFLGVDRVQVVGPAIMSVENVAVACGSAGEFLSAAVAAGCQAFVTGETRFHTCLEAEAADIGLILCGHYASERFGIEALAEAVAARFPAEQAWASRRERDPLRWI